MNALHISDRFAIWKRFSWASANQPHCWRALHIFQRFALWNHYSWTSANQPPFRMVLQISERSRSEIIIPDNQKKPSWNSTQSIFQRFAAWKWNSWISTEGQSSRTAYLYLNVSKSENTISVNQQFDHIAGRNIPYFKVSNPQNTIPE